MWARRFAMVFVVVVALSQVSCSRIKIAYSYIDWVIGYYIGTYVELSADQHKLLAREITDLKRWHCRDSLPRYVEVLGDIRSDIGSTTPTAERVHWYADLIENFVRDLAERAHPAIAKLLASFTDDQVKELARNFEKNNAEFIEKLQDMSDEELGEEYKEARVKDLEHWLGELSGEQMAIVRAWSEAFRPLGMEGLVVRQMWQQELGDLLQVRDQPFAQFAPQVSLFISKHRDDPSGNYRQKLARNKVKTATMVADVLARIDKEQRRHLKREIEDLKDDLSALICRPDITPTLRQATAKI